MRRFPTSWQNVFSKLGLARSRYRVSNRPSRRRWHRQFHLEPLEDRNLLAITVNTLVDENDGIGVGGISLRDAIAAATPGETIDSSVTGTINLTHGELLIDKDLTINGPGPNLLTIDASGNDPDSNVIGGNGSRVIRITDGNNYSTSTVSITGVTITGGDVNGNGGGIFTSETLHLVNSWVIENHASAFRRFGGGVFADHRSKGLTITDSIISGNTSRQGGGVFYGVSASITDKSGLTILRSTISDNQSLRFGVSYGQDGSGGGVMAAGTNMTIAGSTISNNVSEYRGGGLWVADLYFGQKLNLHNSTISGNRADVSGGGIYLDGADYGGAVLRNVTITENRSTDGGGIRSRLTNRVILNNSIVSGNYNLAGTSPNNIPGSMVVKSANNLVGTNGTGGLFSGLGNLIGIDDPELGPLQDNGGATWTHIPQLGSPVIDAGDPLFTFSANEFDQRGAGYPRVLNARLDIGAVESPGPVLVVPQLSSGVDLSTVVPNLDFEDYTTLPTNFSQMMAPNDTVNSWFQLSAATTDYMHVDGYIGQGVSYGPAPIPTYGREGFIGTWAEISAGNPIAIPWYEYAVNVLPNPLVAGTQYRLDVYVGATGGGPGGGGDFNGEAVLYGLLDASLIPSYSNETQRIDMFAGANVVELLSIPVDLPRSSWTAFLDQAFTPTVPIEALVFGARHQGNDFVLIDSAGPISRQYPRGDYNKNGIVDAADYTIWRDTFGESVSAFSGADGNGNGVVDQADFATWKANFGNSALSGAASNIQASTHGDADGDGIVGMDDLDVWSANFGSTTNLAADWSGNGVVDLADLALWQEYKGVTTLDTMAGDFNDDGIVDSGDYGLWTNQDEEDAFYANFGTTRADVWPVILNGGAGAPVEIAGQAPRVVNVTIGGPVHPDYSFSGIVGSGEQLRTVPVGGMNSIAVTFSEEVLVTKGALVLTGMQGQTIPSVPDTNFTYDLATQSATWQFSSALPKGQYLIRLGDSIFDLDQEALDGEFDNPWALVDASGTSDTFPSGDGEAGGEFRFRFTNLSSDFNRNNGRDLADYTIWSDNFGTPNALMTQGDANGDGTVDGADYTVWNDDAGTSYTAWPFIEPGMILVTTLADENGTNPSAMSLREALDIADDDPELDTIVFAYGLFTSGLAALTLSHGQLVVDSNVRIVGPGAELLSIDGDVLSRVFRIDSGVDATIKDLTITGGSVLGLADGGGIFNFGNLTLDSVVMTENFAGRHGGALYNYGGTILVKNSTLIENEAETGGAISSRSNEVLGVVIENSAIVSNDAQHGGGIRLANLSGTSYTPSARIVNSTFSGNEADQDSGAILVSAYYSATIVNSTITDNYAVGEGGGIRSAGGATTLHNTIVAGNTANSAYYNDWSASSAQSASSYNLIGIQGSSGLVNGGATKNLVGTTLEPFDPGLTLLGNHGGPTPTHALLDSSPAIDAGNNSVAIAQDLFRDQRGGDYDRIVDWEEDDLEATIDIGALELAFEETYS